MEIFWYVFAGAIFFSPITLCVYIVFVRDAIKRKKTVEQKCEYKNVWDNEIVENVQKKYPGLYSTWRKEEDKYKLEWHAYLDYYDFLMKEHPDDTEEIDKVKFLIMLHYVGTKLPTFEEAYSDLRSWLIYN